MLKSIRTMLEAFEENKIQYCHWKSNEHLAEALEGDTDLDVLFLPEQRNLLEQVLCKCGLKRFRATPLMQYNAIEDFIGFDEEQSKIWHLHTHYRMTIGESHLKSYTMNPWGIYLIKNRIFNEMGIYTTSPEDELVLLLCRMALKIRIRDTFRKIGRDDRSELKWLKERIDYEKFRASADSLTNSSVRYLMENLLKTEVVCKSSFLKLRNALEDSFYLFTGYSRMSARYTRTKREVFWLYGGIMRRLNLNNFSASRRVSPSGGCVVSILGCDGAGKSTTIDYIKKEFNKKIDVVTIYFGSGDGSCSFIRRPMKLIAQKVGGKGLGHSVEKEYKSKNKVSIKSRLYSLAKIMWAIALANEKKSKFKEMIKARNNGLLVITDRYPQTIEPGCSDGPLLNKYINSGGLLRKLALWERNIYEMSSINPPDLMIKLIVPSEVAVARKPEMTIEEIEKKKSIILKMNSSCKSVCIDTDREFSITRSEVMKEIWQII